MSERFLDLIKPYSKHNLYTKAYDADEHGRVTVPNNAKWRAFVYVGYTEHGNFIDSGSGEVIALVLNDDENRFWPVISFLTRDEAIELAVELLRRALGEDVVIELDEEAHV